MKSPVCMSARFKTTVLEKTEALSLSGKAAWNAALAGSLAGNVKAQLSGNGRGAGMGSVGGRDRVLDRNVYAKNEYRTRNIE